MRYLKVFVCSEKLVSVHSRSLVGVGATSWCREI
jgi:hypothetical protein